MKRIAFYVPVLMKSGAERVTLYLSQYFAENGYKSIIITSFSRENDYAIPKGVTHVNINSMSNFKMRKVLLKYNIDLLVVMGVPFCLFTIPACVGTDVKVIVSERNAPAQFAGKKSTILISRLLMRFADGFVFQTNEAKDFYTNMLKGKGEVIPNPLISENMIEPYIGERENVIVNVGRLNPQKNQALLIKGFSMIHEKYPDYKLIIYGEGEERNNLQKLVNQYGLTNKVFLPGNVYDVHERIKKAAVFAFTSNFEGMPNALIEAMAIGLPCISTDCPCGGPRELIADGENGILFSVGDLDGFVYKLQLLLDDPVFAHKIGKKAIDIRNTLDKDEIGEKWRLYFNKVLDIKGNKDV